jgi:hypothetical protein
MQALHHFAVPKLERADDITAAYVISFPDLGKHRLERREHPAGVLDRDHQAVND